MPRQPTALIADDEPLLREALKTLLAQVWAELSVIAEARNGREAIRLFDAHQPDVCFLDVHMPGLSGIDAARHIGRGSHLVFVTAYDDFAVRAFEAHALDYLVKPIEEARFAEAVQRTRDRMHSMAAVELSRRLATMLSAREREHLTRGIGAARIVVPTSSGDLVLDADEIDWIEADDYYAAIHARGRRHLMRQSLSLLERRLDSTRFVRAHRGAIVNIDRVRELRGDASDSVLVLRDGTRVPVSRRRREQVARRLRILAG